MDSGSEVISLAAMMAENETNHKTIASMQTSNTGLSSEVDSLSKQKTVLQTRTTGLSSQVESLNTQNKGLQTELKSSGGMNDTLAIALIVVVSVMLLITAVTLVILICKEKKGSPVFAPGTRTVTGTPCAPNATYGGPAEK